MWVDSKAPSNCSKVDYRIARSKWQQSRPLLEKIDSAQGRDLPFVENRGSELCREEGLEEGGRTCLSVRCRESASTLIARRTSFKVVVDLSFGLVKGILLLFRSVFHCLLYDGSRCSFSACFYRGQSRVSWTWSWPAGSPTGAVGTGSVVTAAGLCTNDA